MAWVEENRRKSTREKMAEAFLLWQRRHESKRRGGKRGRRRGEGEVSIKRMRLEAGTSGISRNSINGSSSSNSRGARNAVG